MKISVLWGKLWFNMKKFFGVSVKWLGCKCLSMLRVSRKWALREVSFKNPVGSGFAGGCGV